jgi:hypothetical protein
MEIEAIRSWLTTAPTWDRYPVFLWLRPRKTARGGCFYSPAWTDFEVARDEQILFQAELLELLAAAERDPLDAPAGARQPRLELHWPSDEGPPSQMTPQLVAPRAMRAWPPQIVLGSLLDLLT